MTAKPYSLCGQQNVFTCKRCVDNGEVLALQVSFFRFCADNNDSAGLVYTPCVRQSGSQGINFFLSVTTTNDHGCLLTAVGAAIPARMILSRFSVLTVAPVKDFTLFLE